MNTKKLASLLSKLFKGLTVLTGVGIFSIIILFVTKNLWLPSISPLFNEFTINNVLISDSIDMTPVFSSFLMYLLYALQISLYGVLFFSLSQLFKSIVDNSVFTKKNLNKIYTIGISLMGISTLANVLGFYAYSLLSSELTSVSSDITFYLFDLTPGILILTIGLFFSQGIKLQEENELTI